MALIFDEAPTLYDRYRPSYPDGAVDLRPGCRVARVRRVRARGRRGDGPADGSSLVRRGLAVTALEARAPRMAAVSCAASCSGHPNHRVVEERFETAEVARGAFDAVMSATAFHWVDEGRRYQLVTEALRPGGVLILIRNDHVLSDADAAYYQGVERSYATLAPEMGPPYKPPVESELPDSCSSLPDDSGFDVVDERRFLGQSRTRRRSSWGCCGHTRVIGRCCRVGGRTCCDRSVTSSTVRWVGGSWTGT